MAEKISNCWLFANDCVEYLMARGDHLRKFDLIVADPPYNFGQKYADYTDVMRYDHYVGWTKSWLRACVAHLAPHGSMFVFCPDEYVSEIDLYCRRGLNLIKRRHIVWAYTFGQKATRNFTRSHTHVLYFVRSEKDCVFNLDAVAVPSARQLVYKDKRAAGDKPPDDTWMLLKEQLEPYMTPDTDTWLESRICGTYKERREHSPNQLPVKLVERIVLACSNPGDLVLDPFLGTGTTAEVCARHGRRFVGIDVSPECVAMTRERLKSLNP